MNITPINDNIVIQFKERVRDGHFVDNNTESGFIIDLGGDHKQSSSFCRIAKVCSVGGNVDPSICIPGDNIVVQSLMWTEGFNYQGNMYWMTQPRGIVGKVA